MNKLRLSEIERSLRRMTPNMPINVGESAARPPNQLKRSVAGSAARA